MKILNETLEFCREKSILEPPQAYSQLKNFVLTNSASKTVYLLEVIFDTTFLMVFPLLVTVDSLHANAFC